MDKLFNIVWEYEFCFSPIFSVKTIVAQINLPLMACLFRVSAGGILFLLSFGKTFFTIEMVFSTIDLDDSFTGQVHPPPCFLVLVFFSYFLIN